jgi:very-short-patch-repair endonuclease
VSELSYDYLWREYHEAGKSTHQIADELGTYPNRVRRALLSQGIPLRDRAEAQVNALRQGAARHPTRGRARAPEERQAISEGVAAAARAASEDERRRRSEAARARWEAMPETDREALRKAANEGFRQASRTGSSLEHYLLLGLCAAGHRAQGHREFLTGDETQHIDIFLPDERVAIEIDGPSHHYPLFGEEALRRTREADRRKDGLLLTAGLSVVRVRNTLRSISDYHKREALKRLIELLQSLKNEPPPPGLRLFHLNLETGR